MSSTLLFLVAAGLPLYCVGWIIYARFFHPYSNIPGPFLASVSRTWIAIHALKGDLEYVQRELHKRYGPIIRIAPNEVSISDTNAIKVIYAANGDFTKTDFYPPFSIGISPHGDLFTQLDERKHADRRKFVNKIYSMSSILESEEYIDSCTNIFLSKMAKFAATGESIDLGKWIQWYTFDVVGELFFGHPFGFMQQEQDYDNYIKTIDTVLPFIALTAVLPSYTRYFHQLLGLLLPSFREGIRGHKMIRAASKYWVEDRVVKMNNKEAIRTDLLDRLFTIQANKSDFDMLDIQSEACTAMIAGSETTAIAIRAILYHLMKTPEAMRKLVTEIGEADAAGALSKPRIRFSEVIKLPYLVAACKEGMRIHPSVGFGLPRHVPEGGKEIAGRFFPAKSRVGINAAVVHFDEEVFGSNAADFSPDRWLGDNAPNMDRHMLHFGGGSRTCIGKNISLVEIYKLTADFLRSYKVELSQPMKQWKIQSHWLTQQTGIDVHITAR